MIRVHKNRIIIIRNSKHIKTFITTEQDLWDQFTQHSEDPRDKILKQYESLFHYYVQNNDNDKRREETDMNNHNDT